jgi:hypothetical protein
VHPLPPYPPHLCRTSLLEYLTLLWSSRFLPPPSLCPRKASLPAVVCNVMIDGLCRCLSCSAAASPVLQSKIASLHRAAVKIFARCSSGRVEDAVTFLSYQASSNTHMTPVSPRAVPSRTEALKKRVSSSACGPLYACRDVCGMCCLLLHRRIVRLRFMWRAVSPTIPHTLPPSTLRLPWYGMLTAWSMPKPSQL